MVLFAGRFGGILESSYEIDRVWLLSQGKVPYIDFEWPFGVFFLYGPLWLTKILHLSVIQSYDLFWTLASVAGIGLLFATVNLVDYASKRKTPIFLLLYTATPFSIGLMGTHYTMLRYATPFLFILLICKVSSRGKGRGPVPRGGPRTMLHCLSVAPLSGDGYSACVCMHALALSSQVGHQPDTNEAVSLCRYAGRPRRHLWLCIQASCIGHSDCLWRRSGQLPDPVLQRCPFLFCRRVSLCMRYRSTLVAIRAQRQFSRSHRGFDPAVGSRAWQMRSGTYPLERDGAFPCSLFLRLFVSQTVEALPQLLFRFHDRYSRDK